ncbi:hypothetical protein F4V43_12295 [Paenibacillus spiritus]|uniref:Uncharacterized protein n=1 Tax=Paenibacillus spiritus TaxID=2496557 RepID=A0A5J5G8M2_9BACL|nr:MULTISPECIES: hypothetical protein [Paenibacillus]KAA9004170.1 hypothetical protein F4V43_12295 [Paenibacillus spiritus]
MKEPYVPDWHERNTAEPLPASNFTADDRPGASLARFLKFTAYVLLMLGILYFAAAFLIPLLK